MRFLRAAACLAAVAGGLAMPASSSAGTTPTLTISASRSATVVVELPKVSLDWSSLTVSGSVPYAALYFEPLARTTPANAGTGGFVADAMRVENDPSLVVALGALDFGAPLGRGGRFAHKTALPAGRYMVHLLAPKPVTLTLPAGGMRRSLSIRAGGPSRDRLTLRPVAPTPLPDAPGAGYDRAPLPQPPHAMTRTLSILRTTSPLQRSSTVLTGCRRAVASDGAGTPEPLALLPLCGPSDGGDGWASYDSSRRTFTYLPPVPLLIPGGAASTYVSVQYYEAPVKAADQIAAVSSLDNVRDVTAAAVVVALQR